MRSYQEVKGKKERDNANWEVKTGETQLSLIQPLFTFKKLKSQGVDLFNFWTVQLNYAHNPISWSDHVKVHSQENIANTWNIIL